MKSQFFTITEDKEKLRMFFLGKHPNTVNAIKEYLNPNNTLIQWDLAFKHGITVNTIQNNIRKMKDEGLIFIDDSRKIKNKSFETLLKNWPYISLFI